MHKSIFIFFTFLLFIGCRPDQDNRVFDDQKAFVVGHIQNQSSDQVILNLGDKRIVEKLDDGNFRFELELDKSEYVLFNYGEQLSDLFLRPGDSLNIQINSVDKTNEIIFSGTGNFENQFLKEKKGLKTVFKLNDPSLFNKSSSNFKKVIQKYQSSIDDLLNNYTARHQGMDPLFVKQQRYLTKYEMGSLLLDYPIFKNSSKNKEEIPLEYFSFLNEIELNNAVIQNTLEYNSFIRSYIARKTKLATTETQINQTTQPLEWTQSKIAIIENEVTLPNIRANLITESIEWHLYNHACENIDSLIQIFKSTNPDSDDALRINSFANRCRALRPGKMAPTFSGIDVNGNVVMSSKLIGQYIYVDVWATWCGPCKKETPHFEKLIDEYKDNTNITFVSVSFDEKKEMWDRYMEKEKLNGIHLISPKAFESKMANAYGITNIPRYILIDREGKLIDADAPLPSSKEIKSILAKLAAS